MTDEPSTSGTRRRIPGSATAGPEGGPSPVRAEHGPGRPAGVRRIGAARVEHRRDELRSNRRGILLRLAFLLVTLIALYILWPSLLEVLESWPKLLDLDPAWFLAMLACEAASFVCIWGLQRLALRTKRWFGVATAQLAANAFSRVVPGGRRRRWRAAVAHADRFRGRRHVGGDQPHRLVAHQHGHAVHAAAADGAGRAARPARASRACRRRHGSAGSCSCVGFVLGWVLITRDGALRKLAVGIQRLRNRLQRRTRAPVTDLPDRLAGAAQRDRATLGRSWWKALLFALGNWLFDYFALLAAITATGSLPRPTLVLLAYSAAMVLAMIPITPGGLGFVEAGLTGLLALAGVGAGDAVLAVLAYRLVSFWLPLPLGAVAAFAAPPALPGRRHSSASIA